MSWKALLLLLLLCYYCVLLLLLLLLLRRKGATVSVRIKQLADCDCVLLPEVDAQNALIPLPGQYVAGQPCLQYSKSCRCQYRSSFQQLRAVCLSA